MTFKISSPAFENNEHIPPLYTCQGKDINPPLIIDGTPAQTKSMVLIMDDPDAPMGTWDHWVIWNIPAQTTAIKEGISPSGVEGLNSWPKKGYGGPCPPSGTHRYFFKLYALGTTLNLPDNSTKRDVERAMQGNIISQTQLIGTYSKIKN